MIKRRYASEHDITPLYAVHHASIRLGLNRLYDALSAIISEGFSDTVTLTHTDGIDLYKSIQISISDFAMFFKTLLYHVHGEEKIEICFSTNNFDAFIDIKCNYKFTKEEVSELEAALTDTGFNFKLGEVIHLETPLRSCGAVAAYAHGTDAIRHYIFYVIHGDSFKL